MCARGGLRSAPLRGRGAIASAGRAHRLSLGRAARPAGRPPAALPGAAAPPGPRTGAARRGTHARGLSPRAGEALRVSQVRVRSAGHPRGCARPCGVEPGLCRGAGRQQRQRSHRAQKLMKKKKKISKNWVFEQFTHQTSHFSPSFLRFREGRGEGVW